MCIHCYCNVKIDVMCRQCSLFLPRLPLRTGEKATSGMKLRLRLDKSASEVISYGRNHSTSPCAFDTGARTNGAALSITFAPEGFGLSHDFKAIRDCEGL